MHLRFGSVVLDTAFRLIIPFILVFAVYVLVHGHYSPGGGFQGGTLLAISVILVRLVRGRGARWGVGRKAAIVLACAGTLIFAGIGILTVLLGGNVLEYGRLPLGLSEAEVHALGTLGIEIGVMIAVMGVFLVIFDSLTGREEETDDA